MKKDEKYVVGQVYGAKPYQIKVLESQRQQPHNIYTVLYLCCGKIRQITEHGLNQRLRKNSVCRHCRKKYEREWVLKPGEVVANMKVIDVDNPGEGFLSVFYRVEALCCGGEISISHKALITRRNNKSEMCRLCMKRKTEYSKSRIVNVYNVASPTWPRPSWISPGEPPSWSLR